MKANRKRQAPRGIRVGKCRYDRKSLFRTYEDAAGVAGRLGEDCHVYWCAIGGGYHVTSSTHSEYEQLRSSYVPPKEQP